MPNTLIVTIQINNFDLEQLKEIESKLKEVLKDEKDKRVTYNVTEQLPLPFSQ